jgi:hypothetical protein
MAPEIGAKSINKGGEKMNKAMFMLALVSLLSVGLMASTSYAAGTTGRSGFMMLDSYNLIGAPVKDSHGELMGIVNEVMVDSRGNAFAVINHGDYDLYGSGGVNTLVPLQELRISPSASGRDIVTLKMDMEHFDLAPYLNPARKETRQEEANIYEYYGIQPSWSQSSESSK